MQLLSSLLKQISYESVRGEDDRKITDICCHSEKVKEGSLFVCINGYRNNGHEYVPQAVEHGAAVLVVDDRYVIGSRSEDVRSISKTLNSTLEGRGGGKPEMVQGSVKGTEDAVKEIIARYQ